MNLLKLRPARYGLAAVMIVGAASGFWRLAWPSKPPPSYLSTTASLSDIDQTVLAIGTLAPIELVNVGAQVSGQVKSLKVALGDRVAKGQVIAIIDPVPLENAMRNAEAALAQDHAQLEAKKVALRQDELTLKRETAMLAEAAIPQADFDAAAAAADMARADIAALEAQITQAAIAVDTARVNLGYTKITSPIDGEVIAVLVKQGQTVNSVYSTPIIAKIAKLDTMTVKAQISEADIIRIEPDQKVYFTILGDSLHRYYAKLRAIEPAPEAFANDTSPSGAPASTNSSGSSNSAVYYNALFDVANADHRLRTSMTVQVNVVIAEARQVVVVPSNAIHFDADASASPPSAAGAPEPVTAGATLRVIGPSGEVQPRRVRVGINNSVNAQIVEGLSPGERVVISDAADAAAAAKGQPKVGM